MQSYAHLPAEVSAYEPSADIESLVNSTCMTGPVRSTKLLVYPIGNINTDAGADQGGRQEEWGKSVLHPDGREGDAGYADTKNRQQGIADY